MNLNARQNHLLFYSLLSWCFSGMLMVSLPSGTSKTANSTLRLRQPTRLWSTRPETSGQLTPWLISTKRLKSKWVWPIDYAKSDSNTISSLNNCRFRPKEGILFLERTEANWTKSPSFSRHVWWHKSLHYFQMGDYESAITLYDDTIKPMSVKGKQNIRFGCANRIWNIYIKSY